MTDNQETKKKFVEPTFHFTSKQIKIGEDYTTNTIPVSEFVQAEQLLADFPNFHRFEAKGYEKSAIELGENTHYSEDGESILASTPGFPKIKTQRIPGISGLVTEISVEPLFKISDDKMKVVLSIHPPLEDGRTLQNASINTLLEQQGIVFGIDSKAIDNAQAVIAESAIEFNTFTIAKGQPIGKSVDSYLRYDMEIGPIAGTILADGSIDFRDRRIMIGVKEGEKIATKIPAVQGSPGINVYGDETPAKEGKDIKIGLLNDAKFSPETLQVTATKDGVLSVVNSNTIKVCSHQVIQSDIDYETGNIESLNCITVNGSIQPGFKVDAGSDVKISGSVMSATISSLGNLVVDGGITGSSSTLSAGGDADILFIEQGKLECGGICVIRKQSYYSDILAGSDIHCRNSSSIIGGRLIAGGSITVGDAGSENSKPCIFAAGVVAKRFDLLNELKESVIEQQDAIVQWLQRYRGSSTSKKVKKMESALADTKLQLMRMNMIPGTGIYSKAGAIEKGEKLEGPDYSDEDGIAIEEITIDVQGTIFAGTTIYIGNQTIKLEKTVSKRQFKLHSNKKRILAVPLK